MNPFSLEYLHGNRLWAAAAVLALAVVYIALQFTRRQYAVRFTNLDLLDKIAPARPDWRRHVPAALFVLMGLFMVVAWAEPIREEPVARETSTIVLAIDTSLSMMADDVDPSRFVAAQSAARQFVADAPETAEVGLVSFDGNARVRVNPTTERDGLLRAIDDLFLDEGTAIGEALALSLEVIGDIDQSTSGDPIPTAVVLMSDGETTVGQDNAAGIELAQELGVPVTTIAFGTPFGTIELDEVPGPIDVGVKEEELIEIAEATGGTFFNADSIEQLAQIYADVGTEIGTEPEIVNLAGRFVGWGLLLAALAAALNLLWFQRLP
ncbi:MAG: VWA domain-containing protein [Acidimicrobiales bacterium]|nr:VWA domain-containing protein [Acidimicrobiales bacterium]